MLNKEVNNNYYTNHNNNFLFIRSFMSAKKYKKLWKRSILYGTYTEVNNKIKEIENSTTKNKILYITNGLIKVQFNEDNKKNLIKDIEEISNTNWNWLSTLKKGLEKKGYNVYNHFDEITLDFDSNLNDILKENTNKISIPLLFWIFEEILNKFQFLYVKKVIISKYNDFTNVWNFQITFWFNNVVNKTIKIHEFYKKLLKLKWLNNNLLFDPAMKSVSQLKMRKVWGNSKRNYNDIDTLERKTNVIEFNFNNWIEEKAKWLNFKKELESLYIQSVRNLKYIEELLRKDNKNIKKEIKAFLGNQISLNKKEILKDLLVNVSLEKRYKFLITNLDKIINTVNNNILNTLEEVLLNYNLENDDINILKNILSVKRTNKKILTQQLGMASSIIKKIIKKYNINKINTEKLYETISLLSDYNKKYNSILTKWNNDVKNKVISDINKTFNSNKKTILSLINKRLKDNVFSVRTIYGRLDNKSNNKIQITNKNLDFQTIKDKYFNNSLNTLKNKYWKQEYLTNEQIITFLTQIELDIHKEIKFKKNTNWTFNFLNDKLVYENTKNNLLKELDKLIIKLKNKKKITLEKFHNIITKENNLFEYLYKIKHITSWTFQVAYWTIKTISNKFYFYFKDKFNSRQKYLERSIELSEEYKRKGEIMKREYEQRWKEMKKENNKLLVNSIVKYIKKQVSDFWIWNRFCSIQQTVWYIKSFVNTLENENKSSIASEIKDYLDNLDDIVPWMEDYIIEDNINIQEMYYSFS